MTTTAEQLEQWRGRKVVDVDGQDVGKLDDVYAAPGGEPVLARIASGLLGRRHHVVPLRESSVGRDYLRLGFRKQQIEEAGASDAGEALAAAEAAALAAAYGVELPESAGGYETSQQRDLRRQQALAAEARAAGLEAEATRAEGDATARRARASELSADASEAEQDAAGARLAAERARAEAEAAAAASSATRRG
jgi:hypothetical protein